MNAQSCMTLCDPMEEGQPMRLLYPWDSPGENVGVDCQRPSSGDLPD